MDEVIKVINWNPPTRGFPHAIVRSPPCSALAFIVFAIFALACAGAVGQEPTRAGPTKTGQNSRESKPPQPKEESNLSGAGARNKSPSENPSIPNAAIIEKMTVEIYSHPLAFPDIAPMEVPRKDYETVLRFFRFPTRPDNSASQMDEEAGTIRMILPNRTSVRLCWFYMGHNARLSFSCVGMRYKTSGEKFAEDEALALDSTIRRIHKSVVNSPPK